MSWARLLLGLVVATCSASAVVVPNRLLLTSGRERVHLLDLDDPQADGSPRIVWTWQAAGRSDLPPEFVPLFRTTDECKPFDGGRRILITSSSGGVALVDRIADRVLFHGRAVNAHSADLLPRNRVAVAASYDPRGKKGDALILFSIEESGRELWRTSLPGGHGVVWDEQRQILWALATADLRCYELTDWQTPIPTLRLVSIYPLPERGGHDLSPIGGTPFLAVSTEKHCWIFDRDERVLRPHPVLPDAASIKSLSVHPVTGQLAFIQADRPNWWSESIRLSNPAGTLSLHGEQFYKARWLTVTQPRDQRTPSAASPDAAIR